MKKPKSETPTAGWGGDLALMIALIAAMTMATLNITLRDTVVPVKGVDLAPRQAGPATCLGLDLLCAVPAILVLCRRVLDKRSPSRFSWSMLPLAGLCCWMFASTFWAADKFAALVTACDWTAAFSLAWAASQIVCDWRRLRIVAAAAVGLLTLNVFFAGNYRLVSVPELQKQLKENPDGLFKQRNIQPGSFEAHQLAKKIMAGELMGFTKSANSFGALLVMLGIVTAGVVIQLAADKNTPSASVAGVVLILGLVVTVLTYSKTAMVTPFLAAAIFFVLWRSGHWFALRAKRAYWSAVGLFVLLVAAVVGHGIFHGSLPTRSLAFRWDYWVGASHLFLSSHKLTWLGTGWSNFGEYYLQFRLGRASEEIVDPHNFIVKFFVELGVVGGLLLIGWMLRLWWELSHTTSVEAFPSDQSRKGINPPVILDYRGPAPVPVPANGGGLKPMTLFGYVCGGLAVLTVLLGPDWSQDIGYVIFDSCMCLVYAAVFLIAAVLTSVRSVNDPVADDRPAPWVLYGLLVGVGMFLIHNLVDFSMSEPGPLAVFALLLGSALGMRQKVREKGGGRAGSIVGLLIAVAAFATVAAGVWGPTLRAEQLSAEADRQMHDGTFSAALRNYIAAAAAQSLNADYNYRGFYAALQEGPQFRSQASAQLDAAIKTDPRHTLYYLLRAHYLDNALEPMRHDFLKAISLNPNEAQIHKEYAEALQSHGGANYFKESRQQFEEALAVNDQLPAGETRRLTASQIQYIKGKINELKQ